MRKKSIQKKYFRNLKRELIYCVICYNFPHTFVNFPMLFDGVQTVTYGNIATCGVDDDCERDAQGTVYANIQLSPAAAAAATEPQSSDTESAHRVVYSRLFSI